LQQRPHPSIHMVVLRRQRHLPSEDAAQADDVYFATLTTRTDGRERERRSQSRGRWRKVEESDRGSRRRALHSRRFADGTAVLSRERERERKRERQEKERQTDGQSHSCDHVNWRIDQEGEKAGERERETARGRGDCNSVDGSSVLHVTDFGKNI